MLKKIILIVAFLTFSILLPVTASWLSSAESAFKSAGSAVESAASGAASAVGSTLKSAGSIGLQAAAQLEYCRTMAAIPGGVNSLEYQSQCGNMAFTCQQMMMSNPQVGVDPYCATVSGMGRMMGPWGGATSSFIPGVNTTATPTNTDPNKVGWSVPAPPPYGYTMGMGAYGVPPTTAAGVGALLASTTISSLFNKFLGGGTNSGYQTGYGGGGYYGGGAVPPGQQTTYSANSLDDDL